MFELVVRLDPESKQQLGRIEEMLRTVLTNQEKEVAAIDDLTAAVTAMAKVDAAETAAIDQAVAVIQNPSSTDAQVETAAQAIAASNAARSAATATLVASLPVPAATTTTSAARP